MHALSAVHSVPATLGNQIARWLLAITTFIWGTSQIAPPGAMFDLALGKIGVGDLVFALLVLLMFATSPAFRAYCSEFVDRSRVFSVLMVLLATFGVLSAFTNSVTRTVTLPDIIEVIRPLFYLFVALTVSFFTRLGFGRTIVFCFAFGVISAGLENAYLVIFGTISETSIMQLYNRNVVGNLIAVSMVFLAVAFHLGMQFRSTVLLLCALALVAFSFSKGAWAMGLLGVGCFSVPYYMARRGRRLRLPTRILVQLSIAAVLVLAALNIEIIIKMFELKYRQSFASEVTQSQSTVALRLGHVYSSFEIVSRNPVFGVGVTNWEEENNSNRYWLNDIFLVNDNPHNGYLYVMSGMGIPALLVFFTLSMFPVVLLPRVLGLRGAPKLVFVASLLLLVLISGNFMLHLLSHYFLWVLIGVCLALTPDQKDATAAAATARL